jgi:hypothetical protein
MFSWYDLKVINLVFEFKKITALDNPQIIFHLPQFRPI